MRRADEDGIASLELLQRIFNEPAGKIRVNGRLRNTTHFGHVIAALLKEAAEGNASACQLLDWAREALPRARAAATRRKSESTPFKGGIFVVPKEAWTNGSSVESVEIPDTGQLGDADGW